ncbi:MAG: YfhO family protein [Chloroflexi bacterium]|nr:YfhO family protein [Chloroflexota bacterium]
MPHPHPLHLKQDLLCLALLAGAVLLFHPALAFAGGVLTDYDLFTYFYPNWHYRAEVIQQGRLPLWNPYIFAGVPFLANLQTGVLYPPNLLFLGPQAPAAVALSYLLHLWLAAAGMYLLLRVAMGVGAAAALLGGLVFALGGFFAAQAGHINQVQAAAWLPALALAYWRAYHGWSLPWLALGSLLMAMQLTAGHPQESYLTLAALAFLGLHEATAAAQARQTPGSGWLERLPLAGYPLRWLARCGHAAALLALMSGLGAGLAAVQLVPAAELAALSIRGGGLAYEDAISFSLPPWELLRALLPTYGALPLSEFVGYVGVAPLLLAALALRQWPPAPYAGFFGGLWLVGLFLALGGYNPAYPWLFERVPGLDLFRVPARWLFLCAFGAAGLAALGLETLGRSAAARETPWWRPALQPLLPLAALLALAILGSALTVVVLPPSHAILLWAAAGAATVGIVSLPQVPLLTTARAALILALASWELLAAREALPVSHPLPQQVYSALRPGLLQVVQDQGLHRTLSIANPAYEPGDLGELRAILSDALSAAEVEAYVVATKYQEVQSPNLGMRYHIATLDGYDGGVLPTRRYTDFKGELLARGDSSASTSTNGRQVSAALIRDHLLGVPPPDLLGMLNVKYLIADRLYDGWADGIYHDLGTPRRLEPGQRLALQSEAWGPATALSLATYLEDAAELPQGTPIARVILRDADGREQSWTLRAGVETAESDGATLATGAHRRARLLAGRRGLPGRQVYVARLELGRVGYPWAIVIDAQLAHGSLTVAGATLIDGRTLASQTVDLEPRLRRVHTGDVKVYQNLALQERAYLASEVLLAEGQEQQLRSLPQALPPAVLLEQPPPATAISATSSLARPPAAVPGDVRIVRYQAEQVLLEVALAEPAYLVLTDADFPGWRAWVNGVEAEILRANYLFRAVPLPAGAHQVEFRYVPESLARGWTVSLWTGLGLLAVLAAWPVLRWLVRRARS